MSDPQRGLIVVLGSINTDVVLRVDRRPEPGETVGGAVLEQHPGGKGANQAVAAARCGGRVAMVGRVGADEWGRARRAELAAAGIDVSAVRVDEDPATGVAVITLTPDGENEIVVAPGANAAVSPDDVEAARALIAVAAVLVVQLEVPLAAVTAALSAASTSTCVVLNAAPACPLPDALLARVTVLVVNEHEAATLSGAPVLDAASALVAAAQLRGRGARSVIVTLGAAGAVVSAPELESSFPAPAASVVDTTGAGDAFVGALAARLAAGDPLVRAVPFAIVVGSATTERPGASAVVPPQVLGDG